MKKFFENVFSFLKKNVFVAYSMALVFVIPLILFASTYYNITQFEKNFNHLLQTKALLLENVFMSMITEEDLKGEVLQVKIGKIVKENSDVAEIKILQFNEKETNYTIIASSNENEVNAVSSDIKDMLAVSVPEGIASVEAIGDERFWEVSKSLKTQAGKLLIIKTKLSLRGVDQAFSQSVARAYWILIIASIVLVLLVTNYARLSRYVLLFNKMKEVDQMKDNFISMASHELKTPLTAIRGYIDLLQTGAGEKMEQEDKGYLDNIQISADRLKNLVSDLLEVSRLEQNRIPFKPKEVVALEIVEKVVNALAPQAKEKNLKFFIETDLAKENTGIFVDPDRFEQVLINLAGNALKYTSKGEVKIKVHENQKRLVFSVEDTGIGMNSKQKERLYEKFYRIKTKQTKSVEGTGLGLWITKELTEKMKGEIEVESMEGVGSKFIVSFPKK